MAVALDQDMQSSLANSITLAEAVKPSAQSANRFVVFAAPTQNGWKIPIVFEEVGVPYDLVPIDFAKKDQTTPEYLRINPNGRIPALYDRELGVTVAESGAILLYLAEHGPARALLPSDPDGKYSVMQWIFWQVSGLGPMMGQAMYFQRIAAPQGLSEPFCIERFAKESTRLLEVLDGQLAKGKFVCGDNLTIADIACFPYARSHYWAMLDVSPFANLQRWLNELDKRESFQRGLTVPKAQREFFGEGDVEAMILAIAARFKVAGANKAP